MIDHQSVLSFYNKPVPRYTSYPTAPHFQPSVGKTLMQELIAQLAVTEPVSVYVHIPFCDRLCWFCGCHTKHTNKYDPIQRYVERLVLEIKTFAERAGVKVPISHLHFGGGSPSLLQINDMAKIRSALDDTFNFLPHTEISVEIDPSDSNVEMFSALTELGLTRASVGVQDFHEDVQVAINRPQTFEQTRQVINSLREIGIASINVDALYGLPRQNEGRLMDTLQKCVSLTPDRMALFGYAHVPWLKKHQQMIKTEELPDQDQRFVQANHAAQLLVDSGYQAIGIDHFAKETDSLAKAANQGKLHRNFQGYTTDDAKTLIGFGASSIGKFEGGYIQNTVATGQYETKVMQGILPTDKGCRITDEDAARSYIIERLMCDFKIDFKQVATRFPLQFDALLTNANEFLKTDSYGLASMSDAMFTIHKEARQFTRIVASNFDQYFNPGEKQYSKAV